MANPSPGPRPIGVTRLRRDGLLTIHTVRYRGLTDGQQVRIAGFPVDDEDPPRHHHRQHRHVDLIVPDVHGEHASGLILRFTDPLDITTFQHSLAEALELLSQRRPEPHLEEVPA